MIIFRDDDVFYQTNMARFLWVDQLFRTFKVKHTIAVVARDIEQNPQLIEYIQKNPHIDVQLHCWEHIDLTKNHQIVAEHLKNAVRKIKDVFGKRPTVLYPTWNHTDDFIEQHASNLDMTVSVEKSTLARYVDKGAEDGTVLDFHYWSDSEVISLKPALERYIRDGGETVEVNNLFVPKMNI